jgi:UDP-N-acetylglucosamine--N-acetylmuramyl-(pentapeptide) pyrophosphoryl-undecaprenol N-acetylglucosamine transferase
LVPLPGSANDHQTANARLYAAHTGAGYVLESSWDAAGLASRLAALLADPRELHRLGERAAAWNNRDAALRVVRACERVLTGRREPKRLPAEAEPACSCETKPRAS